jgi:glycosyltransferase involved in cell wall biosynthesis
VADITGPGIQAAGVLPVVVALVVPGHPASFVARTVEDVCGGPDQVEVVDRTAAVLGGVGRERGARHGEGAGRLIVDGAAVADRVVGVDVGGLAVTDGTDACPQVETSAARYPTQLSGWRNRCRRGPALGRISAWGHCLVAVVPSRFPDPCPTVALEAMAAGRPVVGSAVGGLADLVVDGVTGVLVPPGDAAALRSAIQQLLTDPDLRARMGTEGRNKAASSSTNVVVSAWEEVFADVIAGKDEAQSETGSSASS